MKRLFSTMVALIAASFAFGQETIKATPTTYVDGQNQFFLQADMPLYFFAATSPENSQGIALAPQLKGKPLNTEIKEMKLDGHGKHYIRHRDTHLHEDVFYVIHADGVAPKTDINLSNTPKYVANGTTYYGKGLTASLSSSDEMSGVANTYVSLNRETYTTYGSELVFGEEGEQSVQFYATDKVGNTEESKSLNFVVDLAAPETFHNVTGVAKGDVISTSTKIYLSTKDGLSGVKTTYFSFNDGPDQIYNGNYVPFTQLPDGEHTLTYYSVDRVSNTESKKTFTFYLDKTAPIVASDVLGDRFIADDNTVYFSGRTKLKLTAVDNKSGVKDVFYSIDNKEFDQYDQPFYLPSISGIHIIRFYAQDEMENRSKGLQDEARFAEYRHNVSSVYLDLTGPTIDHLFDGPSTQVVDRVFISSKTKITINGKDNESGLQYLSYSLDGDLEETKYTEPFTIAEAGTHSIELFGYDNVNNRNKKEITFLVDDTPPSIIPTFSIGSVSGQDSTVIYPPFVEVYLSTTDELVGTKELFYTINGGQERKYRGAITGFRNNTDYSITIRAEDRLGNMATETVSFKTSE